MSKKMIRVVALIMAILMIGSVCVAALNVFALDPAAAAAVATGDTTRTTPVIIAVTAAVVVIALCVIIPKLTKKK